MYSIGALASIVGDNTGSFPVWLEFPFFKGPLQDELSFVEGQWLDEPLYLPSSSMLVLSRSNGGPFLFFLQLIQGLCKFNRVEHAEWL